MIAMLRRLVLLTLQITAILLVLGIPVLTFLWFVPRIPYADKWVPAQWRDRVFITIGFPWRDTPTPSFSAWDGKGEKMALVAAGHRPNKTMAHDLFLYHSKDDRVIRLTRTGWPDPILSPVFSPNGLSIAFTVTPETVGELFLVDKLGYKVERVSEPGRPAAIAPLAGIWSLDSRKLLFFTKEQVGILDTVSRERTVLQLPGEASYASWSPDRTLLLWQGREGERGAPGGDPEGRSPFQIYVGKGDGTEPKAVTKGGDYRYPAWSPDGRQILFTLFRDGKPVSLGVIPRVGGDPRIFQGLPDQPQHAIWSHDGRQILFEAKDRAGQWQIHGIGADGEHLKALTEGEEHRYPTWRPIHHTFFCVATRGYGEPQWELRDSRLLFLSAWGLVQKSLPVPSP